MDTEDVGLNMVEVWGANVNTETEGKVQECRGDARASTISSRVELIIGLLEDIMKVEVTCSMLVGGCEHAFLSR